MAKWDFSVAPTKGPSGVVWMEDGAPVILRDVLSRAVGGKKMKKYPDDPVRLTIDVMFDLNEESGIDCRLQTYLIEPERRKLLDDIVGAFNDHWDDIKHIYEERELSRTYSQLRAFYCQTPLGTESKSSQDQ